MKNMRISKEKRDMILVMGRAFDGLERKNTDLKGWLAFKMGCSEKEAERYAEWFRSQSAPQPRDAAG